jgi:hypothetical protein
MYSDILISRTKGLGDARTASIAVPVFAFFLPMRKPVRYGTCITILRIPRPFFGLFEMDAGNLFSSFVQSFVLEIVGTNVSTTYITCPADPKESPADLVNSSEESSKIFDFFKIVY